MTYFVVAERDGTVIEVAECHGAFHLAETIERLLKEVDQVTVAHTVLQAVGL